MIEINTLEVTGFSPALHAMRNPMDSWDRSDTHRGTEAATGVFRMNIGENDKGLSVKLQKAGPEHCKHLRMVTVYANITAPLYWWKEADTYRAGVEKVSCSTMHTIAKKPFDISQFSHEHMTVRASNCLQMTIDTLNDYRQRYNNAETQEEKKQNWWQIIQLLPTSYNQTRTVMFSYAALRNIYRQREGHKLDEWLAFRKWCESLPESWMITE